MMRLSLTGLNFIKNFEQFRPVAYPISGQWTIGYGHTGSLAEKGAMITEDQALALLASDVKVAELAVVKAVKVPLTQNQFDAVVSFAFNIGGSKFAETDFVKLLNLKEFSQAADEMLRYCYSKKVFMKGLERRRRAERAMFEGGKPVAVAASC